MRNEVGHDLPSRGSLSRWAERTLWAIGAAALVYCGFLFASAAVEQARGERELTRLLVESPENPSKPANHLSNGSLVGRIRIPELDLSAVVFEGTDESVLRKGVGHLAGTAFPFESGNVVLAAHRDTFFRKLKDIRDGDTVSLDTPWGRYQYQVSSTQVVSPDAVEVIRPTEVPTLTLITCYPFYFFGHAPERFIVSARRMED